MDHPFLYQTAPDMCSVDFTGRWQPGAIFRTMQEASNAHCIELCATYEELQRQGLAWVLTRARLVMDEYPCLADEITINTWPTQSRHTFFPRHYTFHRGEQELGRATTLYVLLDLETRKIASPARLKSGLRAYDIPPPLPMPGNLSLPEGEPTLTPYTPVYTDFDMNGHVNNTRYIDWFMNSFPYDRHQRRELAELLIHYCFEVRHDQPLTLAHSEGNDVSVMQGMNGDTQSFAVQGVWRDRR